MSRAQAALHRSHKTIFTTHLPSAHSIQISIAEELRINRHNFSKRFNCRLIGSAAVCVNLLFAGKGQRMIFSGQSDPRTAQFVTHKSDPRSDPRGWGAQKASHKYVFLLLRPVQLLIARLKILDLE